MKIFILYTGIFFLVTTNVGHAQTKQVAEKPGIPILRTDSGFKYLKTIPGNFIYFNIDILDNIYLISTGNQLKKLNSNGDSIAVFNDVKKYGNPTYIDVNNPLKILVYYKNYSTVVVLDRLLTQRNIINLRKQNIFSVKAIATSYDNNIWIFDEQDLKLKKISEEGNLLLESTDMRQLVDTAPFPQQIIDSDYLVYLYDNKKGFYIFDYYGGLKNTLPFLNWTDITISSKKIMGFSEKKLLSYQLNTLNLKTYELPSFIIDNLAIKAVNGKIYLLKKNGIEIYSVQ